MAAISSSRSPFSSIPFKQPPASAPIQGSCLIEGTQQEVQYTIKINPQSFYSSQAKIKLNGRETHRCSLKLNFPILDKKGLLSKLQNPEKRMSIFKIKVLPPSAPHQKYILTIFSDKFENDAKIYRDFLSKQDFRKTQEGLDFLISACRKGDEEQNREKMNFLLSILKESNHSNNNPASYNAIHILSSNDFPLVNLDLRKLQLPGAHLVGTLLYMSDLSDSNLTDVRMGRVSLIGCKMHRCIMEKVEIDRKPSLNHPENVTRLSPTKNGHFLATCTDIGRVRIWNLNECQCLFDFSTVISARGLAKVVDVIFLGNNGPLITSHIDHSLSLWKMTHAEGNLEFNFDSLSELNCKFHSFIQASRGKHFGVLCQSNHFHLFQICDSKINLLSILEAEKDDRKNFCLSPGAKFIAYTVCNKLILIKVISKEPVQEWVLEGEILRLEFSHDSKYLIGLMRLNSMTVIGQWVIGHQKVDLLIEEKEPIDDLQLAYDSAKEKDFCIYTKGAMIYGIELPTKKRYFALHFSSQKKVQFKAIPSLNLLVSTSDQLGLIDVWQQLGESYSRSIPASPRGFPVERKNKSVCSLQLQLHLKNYCENLDQISYLATPGNNYLLACSPLNKKDKTSQFYFCIWDQIKDQLHYGFIGGDSNHSQLNNKRVSNLFQETCKLKFNKKSPLLAMNDNLYLGVAVRKKCVIWDVNAEKMLLKKDCKVQITKILLTKIENKDVLLICEKKGLIKLVDIFSNALINFNGHTQNITGLAICNKGTYLASTSEDRTLRIWSIKDGSELYQADIHASMSNPQFLEDHSFLKTYDNFDQSEYTWFIENGKLKIYSLYPSRFSCTETDFKDVKGLDIINKRLFKQLGGKHIPDEN